MNWGTETRCSTGNIFDSLVSKVHTICVVVEHCHPTSTEAALQLVAITKRDRVNTVVKVLCYKSGGRRFDSSCCQWIFH